MLFIAGPGREVEDARVARLAAVSEFQRPESIDSNGISRATKKCSKKAPVRRVKSIDDAVAKVADKECSGEWAEIRRRES